MSRIVPIEILFEPNVDKEDIMDIEEPDSIKIEGFKANANLIGTKVKVGVEERDGDEARRNSS